MKQILLFTIILLSVSCSSRKVNKSVEQENSTASVSTTKVDSTKTVTKSETNTKVIDSSQSDEITITPLDSTKEMVVNGKSYKNAVLKHRKVKNNIVAVKSKTVNVEQQNRVKEATKSNNTKSKTIEVKQTERKSSFPWWILILIALGLFFTYRFWKKLPPF